ncbi:hypothetical protein IMPERIA89_740107 [Imperialibacter sp. 89]|nr:hypothetical protein IMPERIA89_740107 [Imperialibacter sp. 89]
MSLQHTKAWYSLDLKYTIGIKQQDATPALFNCDKTKKGLVGPFFVQF